MSQVFAPSIPLDAVFGIVLIVGVLLYAVVNVVKLIQGK